MSQTAWNILTAVTVVGVCVFGFILSCLSKRLRALDKAYQPPHLRFGYRPETLVAEIPEGGEPIVHRFGVLFVPTLVFAALTMAVVAHNTAGILWIRYAMYACTAAACLFGEIETLLLFSHRERTLRTAFVLGWIKWGLFAVWTLGMFAGLFIRSWSL